MNILNLLAPILGSWFLGRNEPFFCTFLVTLRCNARCIMCDVWKPKKIQEMTTEQAVSVIKKLPSVRIFRLSGGEPFLREDMLELVQAIQTHTRAEIIHITSNGFLSERIVDFASRVASPDMIHIKISLNGTGAEYDRVMGISGAYQKTFETVKALAALRDRRRFFFAINHTITDWQAYEASIHVKDLCREYGLAYLPVIAHQARDIALYNESIDPESVDVSFKPAGNFSKEQIQAILKDSWKEASFIKSPLEKMVKRYYLRGIKSRFLSDKDPLQPPCVALRHHVRVLPDGSVPVCLYNSKTVGSLLEKDLSELQATERFKTQEAWVKKCPGCWVSCESVPNAIFDIKTLVSLGDYFKGGF
jgi:Fe-coproporphyrin III synthase